MSRKVSTQRRRGAEAKKPGQLSGPLIAQYSIRDLNKRIKKAIGATDHRGPYVGRHVWRVRFTYVHTCGVRVGKLAFFVTEQPWLVELTKKARLFFNDHLDEFPDAEIESAEREGVIES